MSSSFSFLPQQKQLFEPSQQQALQQNMAFQQPQPLQFQQQQQIQQQQQQQQLFLFTNVKAPATYSTKWADLHPECQKFLLQIEERILEYRDESQRLDQCSRLYDSHLSNESFGRDASLVTQDLRGINTTMERLKPQAQAIMAAVKEILRSTEVAIRSFMMLRPRYVRPNVTNASSQASTAITTSNGSAQLSVSPLVPIIDFYSGLPRRPSLFLQQTVARFEKYLAECRQRVEELEQLLLSDTYKNSSNHLTLLQTLPKIMSNIHDFFIHVAAKVESVHRYVESMKMAYLADRRRRGDGNDPFLEADRRELAKQEAAAKRIHPSLQVPPVSNPVHLLPCLPASGLSINAQISSPASSATSASSLLTMGSSAPPLATSSLFSTPPASTPAAMFTPSSYTTPQSALFSSSSSLFGSASTPSLFGGSASSFSSMPVGTSLFSTPSSSGAATGSGASFGSSKVSRPKTRMARR